MLIGTPIFSVELHAWFPGVFERKCLHGKRVQKYWIYYVVYETLLEQSKVMYPITSILVLHLKYYSRSHC